MLRLPADSPKALLVARILELLAPHSRVTVRNARYRQFLREQSEERLTGILLRTQEALPAKQPRMCRSQLDKPASDERAA